MLQVARISTNPSSNSVSNSFNQLVLETLSQKKKKSWNMYDENDVKDWMYWNGRARVSTLNNPL